MRPFCIDAAVPYTNGIIALRTIFCSEDWRSGVGKRVGGEIDLDTNSYAFDLTGITKDVA